MSKNDDALRCLYEVTGNVTDINSVIVQRDTYRSLVAENEAQGALLRQALGEVEAIKRGAGYGPCVEALAGDLIAAIHQHLEGNT